MPKNRTTPVAIGPMPPMTTMPVVKVDPTLRSVSGSREDWVESKTQGWGEELNKAMAEKDSLQVASIQVLTKRNAEANVRIQQLEALVDKKDERIERLVDIVIKKLGGFDAS
jgi:hypothetical protein